MEISDSILTLPYFQSFITLAKIVLIIHTFKFKLQMDKILENYSFL